MNPQSDFMSEAFHALAQPITALRVTVELGLREDADKPLRQVLEDCLRLSDRLMQEMAVLREIASLNEVPQLDVCDGQELLQSSVEEMAPVAEANGVMLLPEAQPAVILCHPPTFQRALFFLLDETIARAGHNRTISLSRSLRGRIQLRNASRLSSGAAPDAMPQAHTVCRRQRHSF